ncbi:hypothetical protein FA13DRAFT_1740394, partial [Coprinellus micaceus]
MPTITETTLNTARLPQENPLRRRMHLLHRAHSLTSLGTSNRKNTLGLPGMSHRNSEDQRKEDDRSGDSSPMDYESGMESSEEENSPKRASFPKAGPAAASKPMPQPKVTPARPRVNTTSLNPPSSSLWNKEPSPMSPTSRSWYEFDLAVVVALVSPIGNWLTGGDHIKNLLLIVLLIFYLHQIIEIPWSLYRKARPRRRAPHIPPSPTAPAEEQYAHLAATELHNLELFFLFCTLISPLCGALLLRYATAAVLGPDAVSWFSTGLFVLATGMRPWAHLVDRLNERTSELHDFVHYPEAQARQEPTDELEQRVAKLEKSLDKLKGNVVHATEEVYEYVDDVLDSVRGDIRELGKYQDEKLSQLEESVEKQLGRPPLARIGSLLTPIWLKRWRPTLSSGTSVQKTHPNAAKIVSSSPFPSQRSPSPRSSTLLNIIDEEEVVYESFPMLVRPVVYASRIASRMISIFVSPFSAVLRMMFG